MVGRTTRQYVVKEDAQMAGGKKEMPTWESMVKDVFG